MITKLLHEHEGELHKGGLFVSSELLFNVLVDSSKYLSFVGLGIQSDLFLTNGPPISSSSSSSFPLNI
jgi:hypothetical protein